MDGLMSYAIELFEGKLLTNKKELFMKNLSGYKPEAPEENSNNAFKYKGPINKLITEKCKGAWISQADKEINSEFSTTKIGDKVFNLSLQVPETATESAKRTFFKKWNIDSEHVDKKGKSQAQKLADWLNPASTGLIITDEASLTAITQRLLTEPWDINLWVIKFDDKEIQMSKLEKAGKYAGTQQSGGGTATPAAQPAWAA